MQVRSHDIGVCSWCVEAADTPGMTQQVKSLGLSHIQLNLTPIANADDKRQQQELQIIKNSGLQLTAGMVNFHGEDYSSIAVLRQTGGFVPDDQWPMRRKICELAIPIATELGINKISTHIGFIPPSNDEKYAVIARRVKEVATLYADAGLELLMETGQERAPRLLQFLNDISCKNLQINFDPANMILYGAGEPFEAVEVLGRHISHVHVKDAQLSAHPGIDWGKEVPFGSGDVSPQRFLKLLEKVGYAGPLVIEREGRAPNRMADIAATIKILRDLE